MSCRYDQRPMTLSIKLYWQTVMLRNSRRLNYDNLGLRGTMYVGAASHWQEATAVQRSWRLITTCRIPAKLKAATDNRHCSRHADSVANNTWGLQIIADHIGRSVAMRCRVGGDLLFLFSCVDRCDALKAHLISLKQSTFDSAYRHVHKLVLPLLTLLFV